MSHTAPNSAAERVYSEVKELILTNRIVGGELLSEGEIASRCEVSRTPVREAFLRLEAEGWMRLYPKRGALVVPISDSEVADVVDARILLEGHAVSVVADDEQARRRLAAQLRANLAEHTDIHAKGYDPGGGADVAADTPDVDAYSRVDAEFHQLIAAAGGNALLAGFFTSLGERHRRMTSASVHRNTQIAEHILGDHAALIDAIELGDAPRFRELLIDHLAAVHNVPPSTRHGGHR